jgi:hypothetical protein
MTDETGSTNYEYDRFSRLKKETKHLRDSWTIPTHDFAIEYGYNLIGQLKSVTDPFGQEFNYQTDKAGKLKALTGSTFASVTNYIDNIEYRAWGAVKSVDYGNSTNMSQTFNNRLQIDEFRLWKDGETNSLIKKNYQYYNDGRLKFSSDDGDETLRFDSHRFDRSYAYDHIGRLTATRTGTEARNEPTTPDRNITPYKQDYTYNVFNNVTSRQTYTWDQADNETLSWSNNRKSDWEYDADGRLKHTNKNNFDYDVNGEIRRVTVDGQNVTYNQYDGISKPVRRDVYKTRPLNGYDSFEKTEYLIYSTVLGKLLTEVDSTGAKKRTYIYSNGQLVARQTGNSASGYVAWENTDPSNASYLATLNTGGGIYSGDIGQAELDPLGSNVGTSNPNDPNSNNLAPAPGGGGGGWGDPFGGYSCRIDGFEAPCSQALYMLNIGAATLISLNSYAIGAIGIIRIPGRNDAPTPPGGDPGTAYGTLDRYIYHGGVNLWGSFQTREDPPGLQVDYAITGADRRLRGNCLTAILNLLRQAAERLNDDPNTRNVNEYTQRVDGNESIRDVYERDILTAENIINGLWNANLVVDANNPNVTRESGDTYNNVDADATFSYDPNAPSTLTVYGGFFRNVERGNRLPRADANGLNYRYNLVGRTSATDRELTLLHEALHLVVGGFTDQLLGSIILNRNINNVTRAQGSLAINDFLERNCR